MHTHVYGVYHDVFCFLDWEHPMLEEYKSLKNSTLLDTSKAVTIEKAPQLANLSAILSEFYICFFSVMREIPHLCWKMKVVFFFLS